MAVIRQIALEVAQLMLVLALAPLFTGYVRKWLGVETPLCQADTILR